MSSSESEDTPVQVSRTIRIWSVYSLAVLTFVLPQNNLYTNFVQKNPKTNFPYTHGLLKTKHIKPTSSLNTVCSLPLWYMPITTHALYPWWVRQIIYNMWDRIHMKTQWTLCVQHSFLSAPGWIICHGDWNYVNTKLLINPRHNWMWIAMYRLICWIGHFCKYSTPCTGLNRPWGFWEVEGPRFPDNQHMDVVKVVSLMCWWPLPPRKYCWY